MKTRMNTKVGLIALQRIEISDWDFARKTENVPLGA